MTFSARRPCLAGSNVLSHKQAHPAQQHKKGTGTLTFAAASPFTLASRLGLTRPFLECHRQSFNAPSVSKRPLSTYRWPQRRPSVLDWLDSCVQDAVRQLDQAPFVQLVYSQRSQPLETHHAPRTATGPSEVSLLFTCCSVSLYKTCEQLTLCIGMMHMPCQQLHAVDSD